MNTLETDILFLQQHGPALLMRALAQATVRALARKGAAITAGVRSLGPRLLNDLPRPGSGLKLAIKLISNHQNHHTRLYSAARIRGLGFDTHISRTSLGKDKALKHTAKFKLSLRDEDSADFAQKFG
jgi:hypothetical protein